jgi:hypothetical protein
LLVIALVAAVVPFLLPPPPRVFRAAAEEPEAEDKIAFSVAWHFFDVAREEVAGGRVSELYTQRPSTQLMKATVEKSTHLLNGNTSRIAVD